MTPKEELIEALKALCKKHGYINVAEKAGVSDQALYQVINGIKLPSGEPRGIGPSTQRKLEAAYPGWRSGQPNAPAPQLQAPAAPPPLDFKTAAFLAADAWTPGKERDLLVLFCHGVAQKLAEIDQIGKNVKTDTTP